MSNHQNSTGKVSSDLQNAGVQTTTFESVLASGARLADSALETVSDTLRRLNTAAEERDRQLGGTRRPAHYIGALQPAHASYLGSNSPRIEIVGTRGNEDNIVGRFEDFILANAQEQEAEKGYVVETFGAPYVFATGRFTRKYTFAGRLRTTPINHQARGASARAARLRTPQFQLFRIFYDRYLRMSEQIKVGRFTRITIDGEVYEGYVSTMNLGRVAEVETFADFTFTFIGINRTSARHGQSAEAILRPVFRSDETDQPAMPPTVALAELKDALGELELSVTTKRDGTGAGTVASIASATMTRTSTDISKVGVVSLIAKGTPQVLRVQTSAQGVDLVYRNATASDGGNTSGAGKVPVHNSLATITGEGSVGRPIDIRVTSYRALFNYLYKQGTSGDPNSAALDSEKQTATGAVEFKILSDVAEPVTVIYNLTLDGRETWKIEDMQLTMVHSGKSNPASTSDTLAYDAGQFNGFTEGAVNGAVDTGNIVPFSLAITVKDGAGNKLDPAVFQNIPTFALEHSQVTAVMGEQGVHSPDDTDGSRSSVTGAVQGVPSIVGDAAKSQFVITGNLSITKLTNGITADLQDQDDYTFIAADRLQAVLKFNLGVPGLAPEPAVRDNGGQEVRFRLFGKTPVSQTLLNQSTPTVTVFSSRSARNSVGKNLISAGSIQYTLRTDTVFQQAIIDTIRKNGRMRFELRDARGRGGPGRPSSVPMNGGHARITLPIVEANGEVVESPVGVPINVQVALRGGSTTTGSPHALTYRSDFNFVEGVVGGGAHTNSYIVILDFTVAEVDLVYTKKTSHALGLVSGAETVTVKSTELVRSNTEVYRRYLERYVAIGLDLSSTGLGQGVIEATNRS